MLNPAFRWGVNLDQVHATLDTTQNIVNRKNKYDLSVETLSLAREKRDFIYVFMIASSSNLWVYGLLSDLETLCLSLWNEN